MVECQMIDYELHGPRSEERSRIRIMSALRENRFPQAILIDGPAGIGKKKLAAEIMQALLCTDSEHRPCGKCFGCKMSANPEVVDHWLIPLSAKETKNKKSASEVSAGSTAKTLEEITQDYVVKIKENPYDINYLESGALISVEAIRSLTKRFRLKSEGARCVIIAEAERMNTAAANAFLKTLEEVPPETYFILTTTSRNLLLETVRSRCLSMHLEPWTEEEVKQELAKRLGHEPSENALGFSLGSPGRALFFEEHAGILSELSAKFISHAFAGAYSEAIWTIREETTASGILSDPTFANLFLDVLNFCLTDAVRKQSGLLPRLPETITAFSKDFLEKASPASIYAAVRAVQETSQILASRSVSAKVALSALAVKMFDGYC